MAAPKPVGRLPALPEVSNAPSLSGALDSPLHFPAGRSVRLCGSLRGAAGGVVSGTAGQESYEKS